MLTLFFNCIFSCIINFGAFFLGNLLYHLDTAVLYGYIPFEILGSTNSVEEPISVLGLWGWIKSWFVEKKEPPRKPSEPWVSPAIPIRKLYASNYSLLIRPANNHPIYQDLYVFRKYLKLKFIERLERIIPDEEWYLYLIHAPVIVYWDFYNSPWFLNHYLGTAGWPFIVSHRVNALEILWRKHYKKRRVNSPMMVAYKHRVVSLVSPWGGQYYSYKQDSHQKLQRYTKTLRRNFYEPKYVDRLYVLAQTPKGKIRRLNALQVQVLQKCAIAFPQYYDTKIAARYCALMILERASILSPNFYVKHGRKFRVLSDVVLGGLTKAGIPKKLATNKFFIYKSLQRKAFLKAYGTKLFGDDWHKNFKKRRLLKRLIRNFKYKMRNNLVLDLQDLGKLHYLSLRILERAWIQVASTAVLTSWPLGFEAALRQWFQRYNMAAPIDIKRLAPKVWKQWPEKSRGDLRKLNKLLDRQFFVKHSAVYKFFVRFTDFYLNPPDLRKIPRFFRNRLQSTQLFPAEWSFYTLFDWYIAELVSTLKVRSIGRAYKFRIFFSNLSVRTFDCFISTDFILFRLFRWLGFNFHMHVWDGGLCLRFFYVYFFSSHSFIAETYDYWCADTVRLFYRFLVYLVYDNVIMQSTYLGLVVKLPIICWIFGWIIGVIIWGLAITYGDRKFWNWWVTSIESFYDEALQRSSEEADFFGDIFLDPRCDMAWYAETLFIQTVDPDAEYDAHDLDPEHPEHPFPQYQFSTGDYFIRYARHITNYGFITVIKGPLWFHMANFQVFVVVPFIFQFYIFQVFFYTVKTGKRKRPRYYHYEVGSGLDKFFILHHHSYPWKNNIRHFPRMRYPIPIRDNAWIYGQMFVNSMSYYMQHFKIEVKRHYRPVFKKVATLKLHNNTRRSMPYGRSVRPNMHELFEASNLFHGVYIINNASWRWKYRYTKELHPYLFRTPVAYYMPSFSYIDWAVYSIPLLVSFWPELWSSRVLPQTMYLGGIDEDEYEDMLEEFIEEETDWEKQADEDRENWRENDILNTEPFQDDVELFEEVVFDRSLDLVGATPYSVPKEGDGHILISDIQKIAGLSLDELEDPFKENIFDINNLGLLGAILWVRYFCNASWKSRYVIPIGPYAQRFIRGNKYFKKLSIFFIRLYLTWVETA